MHRLRDAGVAPRLPAGRPGTAGSGSARAARTRRTAVFRGRPGRLSGPRGGARTAPRSTRAEPGAQLATGWALAWRTGVTRASLAETGHGRTLAAKLVLLALVMAAAAGHGIAHAEGRPDLARSLAVASLVGSLGVVLLATALPAT
ncbi:hypothetical protein NGM37_53275 [Streptomyces sp. TRM76130]|nr:hypothetical protein [Streptomyces sp. TRM76130]